MDKTVALYCAYYSMEALTQPEDLHVVRLCHTPRNHLSYMTVYTPVKVYITHYLLFQQLRL